MRTQFANVRKFNGRRYDLYGRFDTKHEAIGMINRIRARGRNARLVPSRMNRLKPTPNVPGRRVYLVYTAENERRNPHKSL